jgi:hypothetical protein
MPEPRSHILIVPSAGFRLLCGANPKKTKNDTIVSTDAPGAATCPECKACWETLVAPIRAQLARIAEGSDATLEKYYDWGHGGTGGLSSKAMVQRITGANLLGPSSGERHPLDPDDFGRCYRVLRRFPELRDGMHLVAALSPAWGRLVGAWDELEALYEEERPTGDAPKLYARMKELIDE